MRRRFLFVLTLVGSIALAITGFRLWHTDASVQAQPDASPVPLAVQYGYSAEAGAANPAFHFAATNGAYAAASNDLTAEVTSSGIRYHTGESSWNVSAAALERAKPLSPQQGAIQANRFDRDLGPLSESVIAGPLGVQQLWTVAARPAGDGPLTLKLATDARADLTSPTDAVLVDAGGHRLSYGGLLVYDASGAQLPARFETTAGGLLIRADDSGAQYPVVIDPFAFVAKIVSGENLDNQYFGSSVAISDDGATIAIGAQNSTVAGGGRQAVYVFVRPASGIWSGNVTPAARLYATPTTIGTHTYISGDGSTIVSGSNSPGGPVMVWSRPGGGWSGDLPQTAAISTTDSSFGLDAFGHSMALTPDGSILAIGDTNAMGDGGPFGAVYVFERGAAWTNRTTHDAKLFPKTPVAFQQLGWSVAISDDGTAIAAGAPQDLSPTTGAVYIFKRVGANWSGTLNSSAKLTNNVALESLGTSVAFSSDGKTLVSGGCQGNGGCSGVAAVYVTAGTWVTTTETAALYGNPTVGMGRAIGISGDANTVLMGGRDLTVIHEFLKPALGWSSHVTPTNTYNNGDSTNFGSFPIPFDYSANGDFFVLGLPTINFGQGAAYIWAQPHLTTFSPASGRPGDTIVITGANLYAGGNVTFGGTAAFSSGPAGNTTLTATVGAGTSGNVALSVGNTSIALPGFTFIKGDTQTAITGQTPITSAPGQSVMVSYVVTTAIGTPTGVVTVTADTGEWCTASPTAGSCSLTFFTQGVRSLTASFGATSAFNTSTSSPVAHSVKLPSATSILGIDQANPPANVPVTVTFSVGGSIGTPTGSVTVQASTGEACTAEATSGKCSITFIASGVHTLTATYAGNSLYFGSTSPAFEVTTGPALTATPTATATATPTATATAPPGSTPTPTATAPAGSTSTPTATPGGTAGNARYLPGVMKGIVLGSETPNP